MNKLPPPGEVVRSTQRDAFPSGEARFYGFRCLWQHIKFITKDDTFPLSESERNPATQPAAVRRPQPAAPAAPLFERRRQPLPKYDIIRNTMFTLLILSPQEETDETSGNCYDC